VAAALAGALGAGIAVACSDPYASEEPEVVLPARDGEADASAETSSPDPSDAAIHEDAITVDAQKIDAAGCTTCDCDGDGYNAATCIAGAVDAAAIDCDDTDPARHPNQDFVATAPPADQSPSGDWNCSQLVEKLYPFNVSCTAFTTACDMHSGFVGNPGCGMNGDHVTCKPGGLALTCLDGTKTKRTQSCR
jgi:hypothetical protein